MIREVLILSLLQVEYDMDEEPSEGKESDWSMKNAWQESFPRNKWIGNCTEAGGLEDPEATNLFAGAQRQRACNPRLLEEQVGVLSNSIGFCFEGTISNKLLYSLSQSTILLSMDSIS